MVVSGEGCRAEPTAELWGGESSLKGSRGPRPPYSNCSTGTAAMVGSQPPEKLGPEEEQPAQAQRSAAVGIRLPPAPLPVAFHATLPSGGGHASVGPLPFPQAGRAGAPLDPRDCLSNNSLQLMESGALVSAASAALPPAASMGLPTPGASPAPAAAPAGPAPTQALLPTRASSRRTAARAAAAAATAAAAAASGPSTADPDGSSSLQTVTEGRSGGGSLGESEDPRRTSGSHGGGSTEPSRSMLQEPEPEQGGQSEGGPRKSKYRGVQWEKSCNKWRARIHTDKTRHIGYFEDEVAAAQAWDLAALKHFGMAWEAKLNFPALSIRRFHSQPAAGATAAEPGARQYRGVQAVEDGKFKAVVQQKRSFHTVGVFSSAEEAARAYDRESLRVNGRGAITNFPLSDYAEELERWQEAYYLVTRTASHISLPAAGETHPSSAGGPTHRGGGSSLHVGSLGTGGAGVKQEAGEDEGLSGQQEDSHGEVAATAATRMPRLGSISSNHKRKLGQVEEENEWAAPAPLAASGPSPPRLVPAATRAAPAAEEGYVGVARVGERYQAFLSIDLGTYATAEEAALAHDRAALRARGFSAPLNSSLPGALEEARAACSACSVPGQAQQGFRGVVQRDGSFLALLEIGGTHYELGPFVTPLEAAQAHDRYSLLLYGAAAHTNFPHWSYLAPDSEVSVLVKAVQPETRGLGGASSGSPRPPMQLPGAAGSWAAPLPAQRYACRGAAPPLPLQQGQGQQQQQLQGEQEPWQQLGGAGGREGSAGAGREASGHGGAFAGHPWAQRAEPGPSRNAQEPPLPPPAAQRQQQQRQWPQQDGGEEGPRRAFTVPHFTLPESPLLMDERRLMALMEQAQGPAAAQHAQQAPPRHHSGLPGMTATLGLGLGEREELSLDALASLDGLVLPTLDSLTFPELPGQGPSTARGPTRGSSPFSFPFFPSGH